MNFKMYENAKERGEAFIENSFMSQFPNVPVPHFSLLLQLREAKGSYNMCWFSRNLSSWS